MLAAFDLAYRLSATTPAAWLALNRAVYDVYADPDAPSGLPALAEAAAAALDRFAPAGTGAHSLRAELLGRLSLLDHGPLGSLLSSGRRLDWRELLAAPTIIELGAIAHPADRAFVAGLLVASLLSHRDVHPLEPGCEHVLVLAGGTDTFSASLEGAVVLQESLAAFATGGQSVIFAGASSRQGATLLAPDRWGAPHGSRRGPDLRPPVGRHLRPRWGRHLRPRWGTGIRRGTRPRSPSCVPLWSRAMSTEYGTNQGALLVSVSGPTPVVRVSRMAPGLPTGQLNLLSTPAYVLGAIWALALVVGRANSLQGSRIGTEFLRFARPTVSAMAVMFQSAWPGLPGLSLPTQLALLVALVASISLAVTARLTQGRAYVVLLGLAGLSALALGVAAVGLAVSGLPFSEVGAGLVVQVTLVVALSNAAWRLQRQLVLSDIDVTSFTAASEPRGIDRVASAMFFCFAASIIPPVWIGRRILGSALIPVAMAAPDSAANQLFNSASPWFYAYGLALGSIVYAAILLVPPYQRRGRLVALGCVLGVIAVGPGLTTFAEQARAASQNIVQQIQAAPMTADQLGWVCSTWTAPDTPGQLYVWSGDACRTLSVYEGQVKARSPGATGPVHRHGRVGIQLEQLQCGHRIPPRRLRRRLHRRRRIAVVAGRTCARRLRPGDDDGTMELHVPPGRPVVRGAVLRIARRRRTGVESGDPRDVRLDGVRGRRLRGRAPVPRHPRRRARQRLNSSSFGGHSLTCGR
ncbi:MAG: hypothetical protein R2705_20830 [Ilumatobacteraceae bacterium]